MSQENIQIVRTAFEAYGRGDLAVDLIDPEIDWNPAEEVPSHGHEGLRAYLERWEGEWEELETTPEEFIDAGDRVVVTVHFRGRGRGSGIEVDGRTFEVYTLRNGKIVRMDEFSERSPALEAAGLSG